jgi:hypothetical protein
LGRNALPLDPELPDEEMSQAASQASAFYEEVASSRSAFTLLDHGNFLVFPLHGVEVVPFWSSRARVARVHKDHSKYRSFDCDEIDLDALVARTLPDLEREGIHIGVNWSGARLTGYDVSVADFLKNLAYWQTKLAK